MNADLADLTAAELRPSGEVLRRAQQAYVEHYERCFWFMDPSLAISAENLPRIVDGLRRFGDRRAWLLAGELCR